MLSTETKTPPCGAHGLIRRQTKTQVNTQYMIQLQAVIKRKLGKGWK
jgi:hypothetical protein